MRHLLLAVLALTFASTGWAQAAEGVVVYTVTDQVPPPKLPPGYIGPSLNDPSELVHTRRLQFTGGKARTDDVGSGNDLGVSMGVSFVDLEAGTEVRQVVQFRETYLIEGDLASIRWRLTGQEGEYLGYPVQKAVAVVGSVSVEAWFSPAISTSLGPEQYHGLPGLILVVTEDGGRRVVEARSVELAPLPAAIVAPARGHRVSPDEYDRIVRDQIADLEARIEEDTLGDN